MTSPALGRALRTQLLVMFGALGAAAAVCTAASILLVRYALAMSPRVAVSSGIVVGLLVLCSAVAFVLERVILEPLRHLTDAARDIAAGNLTRHMPLPRSRELRELCSHIDRLAHRAAEDQAHAIRIENLASLGRLAASLAHELGSPLGALRGQLHVLRKEMGGHDTFEALDACAVLDAECGRIERIVRGLLEYARSRPLSSVPVSLNDAIREAIEQLRSQRVLVGVHLTIDMPPEPLFVSADRHDLEQMLLAMLENAVEAMSGRGRLVVRLERAARFTLREPSRRREGDPSIEHPPSSRAQHWLSGNDATEIAKVIVADSGPGVAAQLADRVFDPFFTTKPTGKGAGLGLAIVARVVDDLRGTVWVTKAREGGAAFHILLPVVRAGKADDGRWTMDDGSRVPRPALGTQ